MAQTDFTKERGARQASVPREGCEQMDFRTPRSKIAAVARRLAVLFVVSVLINYPWERAQATLYVMLDGSSIPRWLCVMASLVDGLLVLLLYTVGARIFARPTWFEQPGVRGYAVMLAGGLVIGTSVEWMTIYAAPQWTYTSRMPLLLGIGLVPIAQMLVLPPLVFRIVTAWNRRAAAAYTSAPDTR